MPVKDSPILRAMRSGQVEQMLRASGKTDDEIWEAITAPWVGPVDEMLHSCAHSFLVIRL